MAYSRLSSHGMPPRVNDKAIINIQKASINGTFEVTLYNAEHNAATVDRVILTGSTGGVAADTMGQLVTVAMAVLHKRPGADTTISTADGVQINGDDSAVMWQGLYKLPTEMRNAGMALNIDVRGMRKLRIGESIIFSMRTTTTDLRIGAAVTVFAKLA